MRKYIIISIIILGISCRVTDYSLIRKGLNKNTEVIVLMRKDRQMVSEVSFYNKKTKYSREIIYYDNSNVILTSCEKDNELMNGDLYTYWSNGVLRIKAKYKNDKLNGIYEVYSKEGNLVHKSLFKDDIEVEIYFCDSASIESLKKLSELNFDELKE